MIFGVNDEIFKKHVISVIEDIYETMLFMDAMFVEDDEVEYADMEIEDPQEARLLINHPFPGEIVLTVPDEMVLSMAESLFMLSEDEIDAQVKQDVLNEILNTISGRIMAKVTPQDKSFKLGLPEKTLSSFIDDDFLEAKFKFVVDDEFMVKISFSSEV